MKTIPPPLVVPKPCHAKWTAMSGDERKRFCSECGKHVFNLSAMTQREAVKFAEETQGRECVAYVRTEGGKMHAPNFFERMILRVAGKRPSFARALSCLLPAALAACVSKPTAGAPVPPKPEHRDQTNSEHLEMPVRPEVVPGYALPVPKPGKVRMGKPGG